MRTLFTLLVTFFAFTTFAQTNECGTVVPAGYEQTLAARVASLQPVNRSGGLIVIPVQVHLIRETNGNSVLTLQDIQNELDSVNTFYTNAGLVFYECQAAEMIDNSAYYDYLSTTDQNYFLTNHYVNDVINLYFANTVSTSNGPVCGYAFFPGGPDAAFLAASCAVNGSTLAHELGHYFGLLHTHGGSNDELADGSNCATEGDLICDTPADPGLSNSVVDTGCQYTGTAMDNNNQFYVPDVTNIMSYSRKVCRTTFTQQQYAVINLTYFTERTYLSCITTSVTSLTAPGLLVFPNPVQDVLQLSGIPENAATVSLYDMSGRLVRTQVLQPGIKSATIDLGDVDAGSYVCVISATDGVLATERVMVK